MGRFCNNFVVFDQNFSYTMFGCDNANAVFPGPTLDNRQGRLQKLFAIISSQAAQVRAPDYCNPPLIGIAMKITSLFIAQNRRLWHRTHSKTRSSIFFVKSSITVFWLESQGAIKS